jgi:RecJ-like exonuclease
MNLPGYDAYILRGPEEHLSVIMEACEACHGTGQFDGAMCVECQGTGDVEVTLDEPDGDYEYERRRDAQMDRG